MRAKTQKLGYVLKKIIITIILAMTQITVM